MASHLASTSTYEYSPPPPSRLSRSGSLRLVPSSSYQQPTRPTSHTYSPPSSPPRRKKAVDAAALSADVWIHRDEAVARCFGEDLASITWSRQGGSERFSLRTFPCTRVELVGILVYSVMEERKRTWVVDDGSSQLIEVIEKVFSPFASRGSKRTNERELLFIPPPPRLKNGQTVRVRGKLGVEFGRVIVGVAKEVDIAAVAPEEEARHILIVNRLHKEVYPDFDREVYLQSDLLPPPPKKAIVASPELPRSLLDSASNSFLTTPTKSKNTSSTSRIWSQPPSSPQSSGASLSFSDITLGSEPSASQFAFAGNKSSSLPDPHFISSSHADEEGLKTYVLDYMRGVIDLEWGDSVEAGSEVSKWLQDEMNPSSSTSARSSSPIRPSPWDLDSEDDEVESYFPSAAQPHPSSSRFNTSPEPEPFPPFSVAHLLQVASLDVYARKVVQGTVKDRLDALKVSSRAPPASTTKKKRVTGSFEKEFGGREIETVAGKRREQAAVWDQRLRKGGKEWRQEKKEALLEQVLEGLIREGEVFIVSPPTAPDSGEADTVYASSARNSYDATPRASRSCHHLLATSHRRPSASLLYLPAYLPTLGPLLLHLLGIELDRLRAVSTHKIAGIRPPLVWVSTETLVRRLHASHEDRWHFVREGIVGAVLEALDDADHVEECKGKGWRCVGR